MDIIFLLVLLCVEGLVVMEILPVGEEVMLEVLCCCTVAAVTAVVVCGSWRDVVLVTSVFRRHRGSRLWMEKTDQYNQSSLVQKY